MVRKVIKWVAGILGLILLLVIAAGVYIWSEMPKPVGVPPVLQSELFEQPKTSYPVEGKFIFKSATELAELIKTKQATSVEITQEFINHIKNHNYRTNAFVWLFEKEALAAAAEADGKVNSGKSLGLLHGVPVCIKEEFWIKGKPCTWNSENFQGFVAPRNAAVVDTWLSEGAIILGSTNVPRNLIDFQILGDIYPIGSNPYDSTRTPGGSSGGNAAAIASGFSPLGLGGDFGGSIRLPSAFCGIYGLKTTEGSMGNHFGSSPDTTGNKKYFAMAVAGPMARTIDDIELGWKALVKPWYKDNNWLVVDTGRALSDYKIAWLDEWHIGNDKIPIEESTKHHLKQLIDSLNQNGVITTNAEPPNFAAMRQMHMLLMSYMVFGNQPWIIRQLIMNEFKKGPKLKIDLMEGVECIGDLDEEKYSNIRMRKDTLQSALEQFFKVYDFLIMPVATGPAFTKNPGHEPMKVDNISLEYWDHFHYTMVFNATGHPSLTIPLGLNESGLPVAVQLVGPMFSEKRLIHFAKLIQSLHHGYQRVPF